MAGCCFSRCDSNIPSTFPIQNFKLRVFLYSIFECYIAFRVCYIGKTGMAYSISYMTCAISCCKAEVCLSFITTTVLEQHPRSHNKGTVWSLNWLPTMSSSIYMYKNVIYHDVNTWHVKTSCFITSLYNKKILQCYITWY